MKKGFTLAELIGVIVVLALISLVTIPAVSKTLKQNKESLCESQLNNILSAAKAWGADHVFELPSNDETKTLHLTEIIESGYIDDHIENPVTKELYGTSDNEKDVEITISKDEKKYVYELDKEMFSCGDEESDDADDDLDEE